MMQFVSATFPYLTVTLTVRHQTAQFEALIDTGFSEAILVPATFGLLGPGDYPSTVRLADGRLLQLPTFLGIAQIGGLPVFLVTVLALGSTYLVGRKVIERFAVLLDHGQRVVVDL